MKTVRLCPNIWFRTNSDLLVESGFVHEMYSNYIEKWVLCRVVE